MPFRSLRAKLVAWTIAPLGMIAAVDVGVSYRSAVATATQVQQGQLLGSARVIGEQVSRGPDGYSVSIPPAALELFDSAISHPHRDQVFYRVSTSDGTLLSGYSEMAAPAHPVAAESHAFFESALRGEPVQVVAFAQPVFGAPETGPVLIEVGQTVRARDALARDIWLRAARDHLLILAAATALLLVSLRLGLSPLLDLRDRMLRRSPGTLEPLDVAQLPSELIPLVAAINDYSARLGQRMLEHDRFIADASHQLRTPLTLFNTQVSHALRQDDPDEKNAALMALRLGLRSSIRLVTQLLAATEADARLIGQAPTTRVDLCRVARQVLEDLALLAREREIDLGLETSLTSAPVLGTRHELVVLLNNLVDNALRYCPDGARVTVRIGGSRAQGFTLEVEDDGPGIPPGERSRVFDRFYRLHGEDQPGCGLGLAIVRAIAEACDARVAILTPPDGRGALFQLRFPPTAAADLLNPGDPSLPEAATSAGPPPAG